MCASGSRGAACGAHPIAILPIVCVMHFSIVVWIAKLLKIYCKSTNGHCAHLKVQIGPLTCPLCVFNLGSLYIFLVAIGPGTPVRELIADNLNVNVFYTNLNT